MLPISSCGQPKANSIWILVVAHGLAGGTDEADIPAAIHPPVRLLVFVVSTARLSGAFRQTALVKDRLRCPKQFTTAIETHEEPEPHSVMVKAPAKLGPLAAPSRILVRNVRSRARPAASRRRFGRESPHLDSTAGRCSVPPKSQLTTAFPASRLMPVLHRRVSTEWLVNSKSLSRTTQDRQLTGVI